MLKPKEADISIIEQKSHRIQTKFDSEPCVFFVNSLPGCRAEISEANIIDYLNLQDRMQSDEYFVGMADLLEVWRASVGKLLHYRKYEFDVSKDVIYADLPQKLTDEKRGVIIYSSHPGGHLLKDVVEDADSIYPNGYIIIMQPVGRLNPPELFHEVYVFESSCPPDWP